MMAQRIPCNMNGWVGSRKNENFNAWPDGYSGWDEKTQVPERPLFKHSESEMNGEKVRETKSHDPG